MQPSAFPVYEDVEYERDGDSVHALDIRDPGMSLLDYFAGQVLKGVLANPNLAILKIDADFVVVVAYDLAERMLAESFKRARQ